MPLPRNFLKHIAAVVKALAGEEARLRKLSCSGDPRLLLALRDVAGLRERLEGETRENWEEGWAGTFITPQDIGALIELAEKIDSPYKGGAGAAFRDLAHALEWYADNHFELSSKSRAV